MINSTTANIIDSDLERASIMFEEASETNEHKSGRAYRHQKQFSTWFQSIVHKTKLENVHEGVFRPMCSAHKHHPPALPHVYCFVSQLSLLRDYTWDVEELGECVFCSGGSFFCNSFSLVVVSRSH